MAKLESDNLIGTHVKVPDHASNNVLIVRKCYADPQARKIMLVLPEGCKSIIVGVKDLIDAAHAFGVYQDSLVQRLKDRAETDPIFEEAVNEIEILRRQVKQ